MRRFRIAKRFQNGSGTEDGLLYAGPMGTFLGEGRQMVEQEVGAFGFAGTTLTTDDDTL